MTPATLTNGTASNATPGGPDTILLHLQEDAYQGDAQYTLAVDGAQIGGVRTETAQAKLGWSEAVTLHGSFGTGPHKVAVTFLNDAYGGSAATDRNLYVTGVSYNGAAVPGAAAALHQNGTAAMSIPAAQPAPPASAAGTSSPSPSVYHVATSGSDGGDGSADHPFATLQHAADAMAASGVTTTLVSGGTYATGLKLTAANAGETLKAADGQAATLQLGAAGVEVNGADHVTLAGFTLAGSSGPAVDVDGGSSVTVAGNTFTGDSEGVLLQNGTSHDTVTDNSFAGSTEGIVAQNGASDNAITDNLIKDSSLAGIEIKDGSNRETVDSNMIEGVSGTAHDTYGGGIYLHGSSNDAITHNQVQDTAGAGINLSDFSTSGTLTQNLDDTIQSNKVLNADLTSSDSGAIYILGRSDAAIGTLVRMNFIDGTGPASQHSVGIYLDDNTNDVSVEANIVRNVGSDAVQIHGGSNDHVTGNVLDLGTGHPSAVLFQAPPGDQPNPSPLQGNSVTGNIILTESAAPGSFYVSLDGGTPTIANNDYWGPAGIGLNPSPDVSRSAVDPAFVSPSAGDYRMAGGAGISFAPIDQTQIGLAPAGPHPY